MNRRMFYRVFRPCEEFDLNFCGKRFFGQSGGCYVIAGGLLRIENTQPVRPSMDPLNSLPTKEVRLWLVASIVVRKGVDLKLFANCSR